jgi:hypothetical protein
MGAGVVNSVKHTFYVIYYDLLTANIKDGRLARGNAGHVSHSLEFGHSKPPPIEQMAIRKLDKKTKPAS